MASRAAEPSASPPQSQSAPPARCEVVELRQYTLRPGQRDVLVELFERELIEPQERLGLHVLGHFRDLDDPDRFVWLRGFASVGDRASALAAFYGGPVWKAHRDVANGTMIDSDDVLMLRPAVAGSEPATTESADRPDWDAPPPTSVFDITVHHLTRPADERTLDLLSEGFEPPLQQSGGSAVVTLVTDPSPNGFPALPVREGENVVVQVARFDDADAFAVHRELVETCQPPDGLILRPSQRLRLQPAARSVLR